MTRRPLVLLPTLALLAACAGAPITPTDPAETGQDVGSAPGTSGAAVSTPTSGAGSQPGPTTLATDERGWPFAVSQVATFDEPWAMTFLPDGTALVTERGGTLYLVDPATGEKTVVEGTPQVVARGQGGLGDIVAAPTFGYDRAVYLSWVESGDQGTTGAVVGRANLSEPDAPRLERLAPIWRQAPKVEGDGHFSHRLAVSPDEQHLFASSGDRQKLDPAQDLGGNLGKILRLDLTGTPAADNPFAERGGVAAQTWTYGHRNVLGLAFDDEGNLWASEMGPRGGDELNLVQRGGNYGWPRASNGSHYDGRDIPDHTSGDGFVAPKASWTPSISPGSLMIYSGELFAPWTGDAFLGALSGQALVRVDLDGTTAQVADRFDMGERIREVEQGPDGAIWLLQDGPGGGMLRLTPHE